MTFLGTKIRQVVYWALVLACVVSTKYSTFSTLRLSLDSIFSGLLALTGFVFTARTFITFKLNEVVYGSREYREYVEALKREGAYNQELYDPLKSMDKSLGTSTYMCLWSTIMFIIVAFFPKAEGPLILANKASAEYVWEMALKISFTDFLTDMHLLTSNAYKIFTDATMVYFGVCVYQMIITAKSLHHNISDIIDHWETHYKGQ